MEARNGNGGAKGRRQSRRRGRGSLEEGAGRRGRRRQARVPASSPGKGEERKADPPGGRGWKSTGPACLRSCGRKSGEIGLPDVTFLVIEPHVVADSTRALFSGVKSASCSPRT